MAEMKLERVVRRGLSRLIPYFPGRRVLSGAFASRWLLDLREQIAKDLEQHTGDVVQDGPFAGMHYPRHFSNFGDGEWIAKILGVYEAELHPALNALSASEYQSVINIGASDGYYAVGLARLMPRTAIAAFEADPSQKDSCRKTADLNHVTSQIAFEGTCDLNQLRSRLAGFPRTFILSDCEGAEMQLFPSEVVDLARNSDVLIECHDALVPEVTPTLQRRFSATHNITVISEGERPATIPPLLRNLGSFERLVSVCEFRYSLMNWLFCQSKSAAGS